jgi:hypothetical protein
MATTKPGNLNPDASAKGSISFGGQNTRANSIALRASGVGAKARALSLSNPRVPYTPSALPKIDLTIPKLPGVVSNTANVTPATARAMKAAYPFQGNAINDFWNALKKQAK